MSYKPYIVLGEARESDSEEEIDFSTNYNEYRDADCKGKIVSGEATESDEECRDESLDPNSVLPKNSLLSGSGYSSSRKTEKHQSILVKKLCERNISLHRNINEMLNQVSINSGNELNIANQRLLKCQLQMQEGTEFLKALNSNLSLLDSHLKSLLSINYIPSIKI